MQYLLLIMLLIFPFTSMSKPNGQKKLVHNTVKLSDYTQIFNDILNTDPEVRWPAIQKLAKIKPDHPRLYKALTNALYYNNDWKEHRKAAFIAAAIKPTSLTIQERLVGVLSITHNQEVRIKVAQALIAIQPTNPNILEGILLTLYGRPVVGQIIADILSNIPTNPKIHLGMVEALSIITDVKVQGRIAMALKRIRPTDLKVLQEIEAVATVTTNLKASQLANEILNHFQSHPAVIGCEGRFQSPPLSM